MFVTGVSQNIARGAAAGFNTWDLGPTQVTHRRFALEVGDGCRAPEKNATLVMVPNVLGPVMNVIACQPVG